jgi:hypothetical protein
MWPVPNLGVAGVIGHSRIFVEDIATRRGAIYEVSAVDPFTALSLKGALSLIPGELLFTPNVTLQEARVSNYPAVRIAQLTAAQTMLFITAITMDSTLIGTAEVMTLPYGLLGGLIGIGVNCHAWAIRAFLHAQWARRIPV